MSQEVQDWKNRYDSLAKAAIRQNDQITDLRSKLDFINTENARLGAELEVAQQNAQMLGNELNKGNQAANREVERLRRLCKENGIDPEN